MWNIEQKLAVDSKLKNHLYNKWNTAQVEAVTYAVFLQTESLDGF